MFSPRIPIIPLNKFRFNGSPYLASKTSPPRSGATKKNVTSWLFNSSPWKDPPIFKNGKPSISIRAIKKPWRTVSHNQWKNPSVPPVFSTKSQRQMCADVCDPISSLHRIAVLARFLSQECVPGTSPAPRDGFFQFEMLVHHEIINHAISQKSWKYQPDLRSLENKCWNALTDNPKFG